MVELLPSITVGGSKVQGIWVWKVVWGSRETRPEARCPKWTGPREGLAPRPGKPSGEGRRSSTRGVMPRSPHLLKHLPVFQQSSHD